MMLQIYAILLAVVFCTEASSHDMPEKFDVVKPIHLHPKRNRRDLSTREKVGHLRVTSFSFITGMKRYVMDISLNKELLDNNFLIGYQQPDGTMTTSKDYEHCYYHGRLSGKANTTVVLSTCDGLRGTIKDDQGRLYGIEPRNNSIQGEHIFYDLKELTKRKAKCGVGEHSHDFNVHDVYSESHSRFRRSLLTQTKYVSMVLINDKLQFIRMGRNVTKTVNRAIEIANHVDSMLKSLNARGPLVYVETWNVRNLAHVNTSGYETLESITAYNKDVLVYTLLKKGIRRDDVQLISGMDFDGSVVGMGGSGTICGRSAAGVTWDYTANAGITAGTVAHELGHNLGIPHDQGGCTCAGSYCVMAASGSGFPAGFTDCSKRYFDKKITDGLRSCLFDVPTKLFGPSNCGNLFIEEGEECDCGTVQECDRANLSSCCDATTCKLKTNALCASGPCCKNCTFVAQGTLCRARQTECDLEEACNGKSGECPTNFYKRDGMPCRNDTAYCFEGGCKTHNEQCVTLWGKGTLKGYDVCFRENLLGNAYSNCGKNAQGQIQACAPADYNCGTVQCYNAPGNWPVIGWAPNARTRNFWVWQNGVAINVKCEQAVYDLGPDFVNPSLTEQGTKCGDGKICISRKCVNITSLDFIKSCPNNNTCFNGGICNNNGHCHCPAGFACPDCRSPGSGGSLDSGHVCLTPTTTKRPTTTTAHPTTTTAIPTTTAATTAGATTTETTTAGSTTTETTTAGSTTTETTTAGATTTEMTTAGATTTETTTAVASTTETTSVNTTKSNPSPTHTTTGGSITETTINTTLGKTTPGVTTTEETSINTTKATPSTPDTTTAGLSTLAKSMMIIFLAVVPITIFLIAMLYRYRASLPCAPRKPSSMGSHTKLPISPKSTSLADQQKVAFKPNNSYGQLEYGYQSPPYQGNEYGTSEYTNPQFRFSELQTKHSPQLAKATSPPVMPIVQPAAPPKPTNIPPPKPE